MLTKSVRCIEKSEVSYRAGGKVARSRALLSDECDSLGNIRAANNVLTGAVTPRHLITYTLEDNDECGTSRISASWIPSTLSSIMTAFQLPPACNTFRKYSMEGDPPVLKLLLDRVT